MYSSYQDYLTVLRRLSAKLNVNTSDNDWDQRCQLALTDNHLSKLDDVPSWLLDFFQAITEGHELDYIDISNETKIIGKSDAWLSFTSQILPGDWEFTGEYWKIIFDSIGMENYVYNEGNYYETINYSE